MTNKMTNRKALAFVLENMSEMPADVREKLEKMVEALDNKASGATRKPTAKQVENDGFRKLIVEFLSTCPNRVLTCAEIGKEIPELNEMNNQRISALLSPLVKAGTVVKITQKGKSVFQIAPES